MSQYDLMKLSVAIGLVNTFLLLTILSSFLFLSFVSQPLKLKVQKALFIASLVLMAIIAFYIWWMYFQLPVY